MIYIKKLIIAEKPSVARDLAAVLGHFDKKDGYLENQEYLISWAFGHLLGLAEPHHYDEQLANWNIEQLPIIPESFQLEPTKGGRKQLKVLRNLLNSESVTEVINACDAGREGELIFRRVYRYCSCKKPVKRLWLSETTPSAIKESFRKLREGSALDNLATAADARAESDWLVGINATRAFSVRHSTVLSVGRVQTPTLALVVKRDHEINNFKPTPYWEIWSDLQTKSGELYKAKWSGGDKGRIFTQEELDALMDKLKDSNSGVIIAVEQKETREQPPTLFNLNDLQKEANRRYGMTAQQTLNTAQALYEKHKLITYPRTDSRHMTEAMMETVQSRLNALKKTGEYAKLVPEIRSLSKRFVDRKKVSDHHAIIPTEKASDISALNKNEQAIYDMVARRFMAIYYPDAKYAVTKVITAVNDENFISKGKTGLDQGWKIVYKNDSKQEKEEDTKQEEQVLPPLSENEEVSVQQIKTPEKETKPPKRYTEATLLAAMENAGRLVEDKEKAETLKESGGIGTPATRAAIIERLIKVGYLERQKKTLVATEKGVALINLVPEQVKSVELTASWEEGLKQIEEGQSDASLWLDGIKNFTGKVVQMAKEQEVSHEMKQERQSIGKCPQCGCDVIEGKKGYGCSGYKDGCKFVIWKEIASKKITLKQVQDLLEKGKTGVIKGFKSKANKKFEAILKLNEENKVEFEFPNKNREPIGVCPLCGQNVIETDKSYGCSGYRDGCKFVIWKQMVGRKITENQAKVLLEKGETDIIKGFKSKAGKKFNAALVIDQGKVSFKFK